MITSSCIWKGVISCILVDVWNNLWFYEGAQQSNSLCRTETDLVSSSAFPEQCDVYSVCSILTRFLQRFSLWVKIRYSRRNTISFKIVYYKHFLSYIISNFKPYRRYMKKRSKKGRVSFLDHFWIVVESVFGSFLDSFFWIVFRLFFGSFLDCFLDRFWIVFFNRFWIIFG